MNMIVKSSDEATAAQSETKPKRDGGIQPRKQASKSRAVVKMRRKQIIKDILAGKTQQEAGIAAGFSPKSARSQVAQILANPNVKDALIQEMEKIGMTDDYLAAHHRQLIEGKKLIPARGSDSETGPYFEVPDNQARARGLELAYRLMGRFSDKHEVDAKAPVQIIIRKFCSRGAKDASDRDTSPASIVQTGP
jgi:hypothetical protein